MPLFRYKNIQKIRHKRCKKNIEIRHKRCKKNIENGILKESLRAKNKKKCESVLPREGRNYI